MIENRKSTIEDRLRPEDRVRQDAPAPLLLDGGLATELERRGHDLDHPLWSARLLLENPEALSAVHTDFLEAGADIIATATYQATLPGLEREGLSHAQAEGLFRRAVDLAVEARDAINPDALVAASIGSYGAYLADGSEYTGNYENSTKNALTEFHRERLEILTKSPANVIAFETIPSLTEAESLAELLNASSLPAWISFQCRDEKHIADGAPIAEAARIVDTIPNVFAIGVNCVPPRLVLPLIARIQSVTNKPIAVYPNSGEIFDPGTRTWDGTADPASFASSAVTWRKAGARLIGGCCRATPAHIRALRGVFPREA